MFRVVLLALDGSPLATQATGYAVALAERFSAPIRLLYAFEGPDAVASTFAERDGARDPDLFDRIVASSDVARATAREYLDEWATVLAARGLTAEPVVLDRDVLGGSAAGMLLGAAQRAQDGVLVMATHGRSGLRRVVFGSTAQEVLEQSPIPVLLARVAEPTPQASAHRVRSDVPEPKVFQHVLAPMDGSSLAERALPYAVALADRFKARLTLLTAVSDPEDVAQSVAAMQSAPLAGAAITTRAIEMVSEGAREAALAAQAYLARRAEELSTPGLDITTAVVEGEPATVTLRAAHDAPDSIVVLSTHGRGGLGRLIFGSTALDILHRAQVPSLIIRATEKG